MNGAANVRTSGIPYAGEILSKFGAAWSSSVHQFPVPALFDDPLTKQSMWRERSVRSVLEIQQRVGLFVFGLGSPHADVPSHVYSGDYFDERDRAVIEREGVVGDCATVFYRADGSSDIPELNARSSGPDLDTVRRIPVVSAWCRACPSSTACAAPWPPTSSPSWCRGVPRAPPAQRHALTRSVAPVISRRTRRR